MAGASNKGLGLAGKAFFGGLSAGTFALGVWQTQRYFEKVEFMDQRAEDLALPPTTLSKSLAEPSQHGSGMRRLVVQGKFLHAYTILVGPRGPPPGALAKDGPMSGRAGEGGLNASPQGYYVVTPLQDDASQQKVLVNRGWIPRQFVLNGVEYEEPQETVQVVGVPPAKREQPKFIVPDHDFAKRQMFWFDLATLEKINGIGSGQGVLLTQIRPDGAGPLTSYPVQPPIETVAEVKVTPMVHAGYAATWYSLAVAGTYMTRMLITRGRG
mmetsp:Transcript_22910/g.33956  ORF Transcript_22910/g.33956 Transcript_22910/m.33956 type:complete len:269 (-) Transcript_22910:528-1334(-)|eukprot:CAMPEP_0194044418 /NCGR_PEP_ID=MMETSP0009_2-20130614/15896_1 /TAXON_ID=210454 /ORGANISM="Grammatophora oceanica, Strain CCMP 410" /LENGTH=268 /DNA_ID=CAMNT_0038688935 /DNA_START=78 /DNA_END=884 /DNA_ORIENTATION=-